MPGTRFSFRDGFHFYVGTFAVGMSALGRIETFSVARIGSFGDVDA
jgi:hypothetical protein